MGPDGAQIADATGAIRADGQQEARDQVVTFAVDFWSLAFPAPGDYTLRILVGGSERKRLTLAVGAVFAAAEPPGAETGPGRRLDA